MEWTQNRLEHGLIEHDACQVPCGVRIVVQTHSLHGQGGKHGRCIGERGDDRGAASIRA